ncbi:EamA family transporter [Nonomuraea sp. NPDC050556]|uniref:EamA family transporter n=1 Tax=Nonomuraea sp. NPDC050556 TaxID=3364369 RepID=UPI0037895024
MSPLALLLILVAAVAHASWNLLSKQASKADGVVFLWLGATASTVIWGPVAIGYLVATGTPVTLRDVGVICGSTALHVGYFLLLQRGYRYGDLSMVYPVARGTGPMLASAVAVLFLGEHPAPAGIAGIVLVGVGVLIISGARFKADKGLLYGLATGVFIAAYTVWDAQVVGVFMVAPILLNYGGEVGRMLALSPLVWPKRHLIGQVWREHRPRVLGAAVLVTLSYLLVLIAFTMAPVSVVAPAREVSVLVAVLLGGRLLAEGGLRRRLLAAGIILGGVAAIAFS